MGFEDSDLEIDNIRLRGTQYVRFRDLSKYNKKILMTSDEFHTLSYLTPTIIRYLQQLVTNSSIIIDYLDSCMIKNPTLPLLFGPLDAAIYNRLPQEVSLYRRTEFRYNQLKNKGLKRKESSSYDRKVKPKQSVSSGLEEGEEEEEEEEKKQNHS